MLKVLLVILTLSLLIGCNDDDWAKIDYDPNFYRPDIEQQHLIDRNGVTVNFDQPAMNNFACLTKGKIKELAEILERARLPKKKRAELLGPLYEVIKEDDR